MNRDIQERAVGVCAVVYSGVLALLTVAQALRSLGLFGGVGEVSTPTAFAFMLVGLLWPLLLFGLWFTEPSPLARKLFFSAIVVWAVSQLLVGIPQFANLSPSSPPEIANAAVSSWWLLRPLSIASTLLFAYAVVRSDRLPLIVERLAILWALAATILAVLRWVAVGVAGQSSTVVELLAAGQQYVTPALAVVFVAAMGVSLIQRSLRRNAAIAV